MHCCFKDETTPTCPRRRMAGLPMCQQHMMWTFRTALEDGGLPNDVFSAICQDAVAVMFAKRRAWDDDMTAMAVRLDQERRLARARKAEERDRDAVVYYVALTGDRIKIGWTGDLAKRLEAFRLRAADVLAVEPGGRSLEAERHRQFTAERIGRTEEFTRSPRLMQHIARLAEQPA